MKLILCLAAIIACMCLFSLPPSAGAQEVTWQGTLNAGSLKLRLVFHIIKSADGSFSGTMDSLDQGVKGIPLTVIANDAEKLRIEIKAIGGGFEGKIGKGGAEVVGALSQGAAVTPLTLTKGGTIPVIRRPQTPKPPFPYDSEDVSFESRPGVKLAGTLTLPRKRAVKFPAILLIAGSGPQSRDENILNHELFKVIADYMTVRGFAVLRYDKRGIGKSIGSYAAATTADFADDAEAGLKYLQTRKEIDAWKTGMIGHSEGAVIAPLVASRRKDVAFVVMMAGTGMNGEQILYLQSALIAKAMGASEPVIIKTRTTQEKIFAVAKADIAPAEAARKMKALEDELWAAMTEKEQAEAHSIEAVYAQGNALLNPWMHYFLKYDPVPALRKLTCPVLVLNGSKDLQVPPTQNLKEINSALTVGGNKDFTVKELPNLNHLFQDCLTGSPSEYGEIEETISPAALKIMGDWIAAHTVH